MPTVLPAAPAWATHWPWLLAIWCFLCSAPTVFLTPSALHVPCTHWPACCLLPLPGQPIAIHLSPIGRMCPAPTTRAVACCLLPLQLDSWSVGALAYDVLCGRAPFASNEDVPREEEKKGILFHVSPATLPGNMCCERMDLCLSTWQHLSGCCIVCDSCVGVLWSKQICLPGGHWREP